MRIEIVPCLKDNYSYLLVCEKTGACAIVDASEHAPIIAAVQTHAVVPTAIWSTHHHFDHTGGNESVAEALKIGTIVAHESDKGRVPGQTMFVKEGDSLTLGELDVHVLHIPGHTLGAIAYVVKSGAAQAVFTGDTMFVAGCGRLFEGTPEMMFESMSKLSALSADTRMYCGHKYTEANLRFAAHIEPNNTDVKSAIDRARATKITVPSTIGDERACNPFVRAKDAAELGARRAQKDSL